MSQETVACKEYVLSMMSGYMNSHDIGTRRDIVKTDLLFFISSSFIPLLIFLIFLDMKYLWFVFVMIWGVSLFNKEFFYDLNYIKEKRSPKDFYREKLRDIQYKGDLSDIFDLHDEIIKHNIKHIKSSLILEIEKYGSISGRTLVQIIDKTTLDKQKSQNKILVEEKKNIDPSIEKRINEINNIQ